MLLSVSLVYKYPRAFSIISLLPFLYPAPLKLRFPSLVSYIQFTACSPKRHILERFLNMPNLGALRIRKVEESDVGNMSDILTFSFRKAYPRLWQLMYEEERDNEMTSTVTVIVEHELNQHLSDPHCKYMIAYDTTCYVSDVGDTWRNLDYGWISLSVVSSVSTTDFYTSDLTTLACLKELHRVISTGENVDLVNDSRSRLLYELHYRSKRSQARYFTGQYLVVNALAFWPECDEDEVWDMAIQLLGTATDIAERDHLPMWTQITADQKDFFLDAGFTEVAAFTLNLNDYKPHGCTRDWGTQEWVQMSYRCN